MYWSFNVRVDIGLDCTIVQQLLPSKIICVVQQLLYKKRQESDFGLNPPNHTI